jgi:hypothetical protein
MRQYIIAYDLYRPVHNYSDLTGAIKRLADDWEHQLANLWIIETDLNAEDIGLLLAAHLASGDKLYIREGGYDLTGIEISPGEPMLLRTVGAGGRAPVKLLARVLPRQAPRGESHLLMAATAESW